MQSIQLVNVCNSLYCDVTVSNLDRYFFGGWYGI